eukprot:m.37132 g.37132  ORF g.37132 m.37132 type:complete len:511 (+) comp17588_c0_seq1:319-1851(+)
MAVRHLLLIGGLANVFLFSGILFGWSQFTRILLDEGQYNELCSNLTTTTAAPTADMDVGCKSQNAQLELVFTLGSSTFSILSLPAGIFLDRYGTHCTILLAGVFSCGGLVLLGFADSKTFDVFIPGAISISAGGLLSMLAAFPISFRFPRYQAAILAAISCTFDGSSLVFALYHKFGLVMEDSRKFLLLGHAALGVLVYGVLFVGWSRLLRFEAKEAKLKLFRASINDDNDNNVNSNNSLNDDRGHGNQGLSHSNDTHAAVSINGNERAHVYEGVYEDDYASDTDHNRADTALLSHRSWMAQLRTFEFFCIAAFSAIQMLRANAYIGFNDQVLAELGDEGKDNYFTNLFGWVLPAGVIFVPIIDWWIRKLGLANTLHATNFIGLVFGAMVLIPSLPAQVGTFIAFTCYRAFLYATVSTFIAQVFGLETLGRITGFVYTTASCFNLLQYPLQTLISDYYDGNPFWVSAFCLALDVPIIVICIEFQRRYTAKHHLDAPKVSELTSPVDKEFK